jgi:hypothetical protein
LQLKETDQTWQGVRSQKGNEFHEFVCSLLRCSGSLQKAACPQRLLCYRFMQCDRGLGQTQTNSSFVPPSILKKQEFSDDIAWVLHVIVLFTDRFIELSL